MCDKGPAREGDRALRKSPRTPRWPWQQEGPAGANPRSEIESSMEQSRVEIMEKYRLHEKDTGSPEVQVALLTTRISAATEHLKLHKKDFASRRGLLKMVSKRTSLLRYLAKTDRSRYKELIRGLGLRK